MDESEGSSETQICFNCLGASVSWLGGHSARAAWLNPVTPVHADAFFLAGATAFWQYPVCLPEVQHCNPPLFLRLQSPDTGPELFVEVLGTLATAADAAGSYSSRSSNGPAGGGMAATEADTADASILDSSSGVAPWQLMRGVGLQDLLALLAACLQPGACKRMEGWWLGSCHDCCSRLA